MQTNANHVGLRPLLTVSRFIKLLTLNHSALLTPSKNARSLGTGNWHKGCLGFGVDTWRHAPLQNFSSGFGDSMACQNWTSAGTLYHGWYLEAHERRCSSNKSRFSFKFYPWKCTRSVSFRSLHGVVSVSRFMYFHVRCFVVPHPAGPWACHRRPELPSVPCWHLFLRFFNGAVSSLPRRPNFGLVAGRAALAPSVAGTWQSWGEVLVEIRTEMNRATLGG